MHEINTDYYKVVHEERRRMATQFFYEQRMAESQRQERRSALHVEVNLSAVQRLIRFTLKVTRRRVGVHAVE